jgi:carboxyl-terminal processing protease
MQKKLSIALAILLPFVAYFWGFQNGAAEFSARNQLPPELADSKAQTQLDLTHFWQLWSVVEGKYVDKEALDPQQMLYGAMKGIVHSLGDPHSEFLDPTESEEFLDGLNGGLTGIGAEVGIRDEVLVVISPLRGSPAEKAGLLPGDHIFKIDDALAGDFSLFEAVKRIRGEAGTTVTLTIFRAEEIEPREITITRDFIDVKSVESELRDDGIVIVTVNTFAEDTASEFEIVLSDLALENPKGMILDLRYNGGGYLEAAIQMTSKLLASGNVVSIHERGLPDMMVPVTGMSILPEIPLVVLINGGSASASEIMAGALQDAGRATLVGTQSFGKGTVQELIDTFADGSTLRITVAKWFTPSGRDVTVEQGIAPDIEVKMTNADYAEQLDPQLEAAIDFLKK